MLLSVDTSGASTSVALFSESSELAGCISETSDSHSTRIEVLVKEILHQNKIGVSELTGILLGTGPGSFTGLRISFAFAKGLAIGLRIGIYRVPTLQAIGYQFLDRVDSVLVLEDARRQEYFAASMHVKQDSIKEQIVNLQWIEEWRAKYSNSMIVSQSKLEIETNISKRPLAECLGNFFFSSSRPISNVSPQQLADLTPDYIRKVSAMSIKERQEQGMLLAHDSALK